MSHSDDCVTTLAGTRPLVVVGATREDCERHVAREIADLLRAKPVARIGLATGGSMTGLYSELARLVARGETSFARATTFNLDEYVGLARDDARSFRAWMREELFEHVDLPAASARFPDVHAADLELAARAYESAIADGGLDLVLLGIGRNGHLAFNEPGSTVSSRTRVVELAPSTREDAARAFGSLEQVPRRAITMGLATILASRRVRVLAFGAAKSAVARAAVLDVATDALPATRLREHADAVLYVDRAAGSELVNARAARA